MIVIYDNIAHTNSNTPIPADDPDDTNPHDGVYVLPISDNGLVKQPFAPNFVMVNGLLIENVNGSDKVYSFEPTPTFTGGDFNGDEYRELAHFEVDSGLGTQYFGRRTVSCQSQ